MTPRPWNEIDGLRDDAYFATLEGEERDRYEAAYRSTFVGKWDELAADVRRCVGPLVPIMLRLIETARLGRHPDR